MASTVIPAILPESRPRDEAPEKSIPVRSDACFATLAASRVAHRAALQAA